MSMRGLYIGITYFSGPNDGGFQISNMHSFSDNLHIHLFDEILVDILQDERMRDTTIHQRVERNWLGSLRIPFSTLYFKHQVQSSVRYSNYQLPTSTKKRTL